MATPELPSLRPTSKELQKHQPWGAWVIQSVEHSTLDLGGCVFEPHIGHRDYVTNKILKKKSKSQNMVSSKTQQDSSKNIRS